LDGDVTRSKYMVIKAVPGYQFRLVAAVTIDNYFKPVQQSISAAQGQHHSLGQDHLLRGVRALPAEVSQYERAHCAFVLALAMLFGMWFANRITRPVLNLRELFLKMAGGDFTTPAQEKGAEELRSLSASYNALRERVGSLLHQVQRSASAHEHLHRDLPPPPSNRSAP
jgi:methyl-accepting chemotaxis protein